MKKSLKSVMFAGVLALALAAQSAFAAYTISVETFRNASGRYVPVDSIMEMMITELVNSGTFQVVERSRMDVIAREQRMAQHGLTDRRGAPQSGRLAGAQYIITGAVTKYETTNTGGAAGAILGGYRGGLLSGLTICENTGVTGSHRIKIYFYVNGCLKLVSKELPEFAFRELNDVYQKQEGVPFSISLGGGTQGLMETIGPDYMNTTRYLLPLERDFGGSFIGDIKSFKMYACPLNYSTIRDYLSKNN